MKKLLVGAIGLAAVAVAVVLVANAVVSGLPIAKSLTEATVPGYVPGGAPFGMIGTDPDDPDDPWSAEAPPGGAILQTPGPTASPGAVGTIRVHIPKVLPTGPRRVGIPVGHWKTDEAPSELRRLVPQRGAGCAGVGQIDRRCA